MFLTEFDEAQAIIEPGKAVRRVDGMPKVCIGVFSNVLAEAWVARLDGEIVTLQRGVGGDVPVYKLSVDQHEIAMFCPPVGAPSAVACMEELIAKGVESFVFCGSCGVLRRDIVDGHLIVPMAAIRDEGTSFHYVAPSDEIMLDEAQVQTLCETLEKLELLYVKGKTWTTDAFYRETVGRMQKAKAMGAICVEMECAALAAVAQYRKVPFMQFLWAADNLDTAEWDKRGLSSRGLSISQKCMMAAFELAKGMLTC